MKDRAIEKSSRKIESMRVDIFLKDIVFSVQEKTGIELYEGTPVVTHFVVINNPLTFRIPQLP